MTKRHKIFLDMIPPNGWGSNGNKVTTAGGHPRLIKGKNVRETEHTLTQLLAMNRPADMMEGPLSLRVTIVWPHNKSASKKVQAMPLVPKKTKPDGDNCLKSLKDVMQRLGFYKDDALIWREAIRRFHGQKPGVYIDLETDTEEDFEL